MSWLALAVSDKGKTQIQETVLFRFIIQFKFLHVQRDPLLLVLQQF